MANHAELNTFYILRTILMVFGKGVKGGKSALYHGIYAVATEPEVGAESRHL